jgi:hypothetical protein
LLALLLPGGVPQAKAEDANRLLLLLLLLLPAVALRPDRGDDVTGEAEKGPSPPAPIIVVGGGWWPLWWEPRIAPGREAAHRSASTSVSRSVPVT